VYRSSIRAVKGRQCVM